MNMRTISRTVLILLSFSFSVTIINSKKSAIGTVRAYPNPFNNQSQNIRIDKNGTAFTGSVKITVYDFTMKKVFEDTQTGTLSWSGYGSDGRRLGTGLYYIKLVETISGTNSSEDGTINSQIIKVLIK